MSAISTATTSSVPRLLVTTSPHIQSGLSASRVMWDVNLAMLPALVMATHNFGLRAALVIGLSVAGAVAAEFLIQKFLLQKPSTLSDGSAVVTGILLAFCVPAALPLWVAFVGGFVAIALGKQAYGGLGQNIFNPAHVARAVLLASWPVYMTTWLKPGQGYGIADAITTATPLGLLKETARDTQLMEKITAEGGNLIGYVMQKLQITFSDLFLGVNFSGSLGETSKLALIIGGIYLLIRGHISWHGPVAMTATVFAGAFIVGGSLHYALFHLLTGGLIIGALFMITDMVTSPMTNKGHLLFGFGCGAITLLIRLKGGYPEGVCYSILIMNAFVPLIDKFMIPKRFGTSSQETVS
ncbi:MAG TPA: RnfABCDGE type electron transport complex subunit D [Candidatus Rifleibacterium sp.]|nr:RnfABCDGE type electron transport complex subunit D [Candidatus Rifleibacterium sp.]HPW59268.1 RnfABCDGE type electron transport complex subunit D [Candidatus Rifleibacterium sp.]